MADSIYSYRTPAKFPDSIRIGDDEAGDFSNQEYDAAQQRHKTELFASSAIIATWEWGADGNIRFNGDLLESVGSGLSEADLTAVNTVSTNIAAVTSCHTNIDGIIAVADALENGDFDQLADAVLAKEGAEAAQTASEAAAANSGASALAAAGSAATAASASLSAATDATEAQAAATLAEQWASASADTEIEPGLKSARAYSQDAQAFARAIAGIPYREQTTATTELTKSVLGVPGDEFSAILCSGATNKTITLPADFNSTPALDGRPALVPVRVIRTGAGTVTLAGAGGTSTTPPSVIGEWQAAWQAAADPPAAVTSTLVRSITVPAGLKRFLFVVAAEINNSATSHTITLAASVGTVAVRTADTAPTGRFIASPFINAKSWTVDLGDSASASTPVDLTFTIPSAAHSFVYKVWAAKDVNAVSGAIGSSITTPATGHNVSVTATAAGLAMAGIFAQGNWLPTTLTGGTPSTAISSGPRSGKDLTMITGHLANAPAGANAFAATGDEIKEGAVAGICFEAGAGGGGTGVTVVGTPLTVAANSWIDIMAASDGRTYYVMHGA